MSSDTWHDITPFGKKIFELHPDVRLSKNEKNEKWAIILLRDENEKHSKKEYKEIHWKGRTVVVGTRDQHKNDYLLKNCFTVGSNVKDVIYTRFYLDEKSSGLTRCLCVLEKECINIFTNVGEQFITSVPFKVKKMWGLKTGLCVEREPTSSDTEEEKGMPTLFSLTHPLEDFKPVVYHYKDNRKAMYFTHTSHHIVFTCPIRSLVITYDTVLGLHFIWKTRKALEKDYPEVASHQDSLPEFLAFGNQSTHTTNVKDQSRLSISPSTNKRHSCPPVPMLMQRRSSPVRNTSPKQFHGTHGLYDSSYVGSDLNSSRKTHVPSSPLFMFRMSCADNKFEEEPEPLPPNICLEQIWQEEGNMIRYGLKGKTEKVFNTKDFYGNDYIVFNLQSLSKIRILKLRKVKSSLTFEKVMETDCLDTCSLEGCRKYVLLDPSQTINLYTGKQKIMKVQIPDAFSNYDRLSLSNFNGNLLTVSCTKTDAKITIEIPRLCFSNLVFSCIQSLQKVLSDNDYNLVYSKYYSLFQESRNSDPMLGDWELFMAASLKLLGFPESSLKLLKENVCSPHPPEPKKAKKSYSMSCIEDWEYLVAKKPKKLIDDDRLDYNKDYMAEINLQKTAPLYQHCAVVFNVWNNLYEELKLNTLEKANLLNFAKFLRYLSEVFSISSCKTKYETDFPVIKEKRDTVYKLKEEHESIYEELKKQSRESLSLAVYEMLITRTKPKLSIKDHNGKFSTVVVKIFTAIIKYIEKVEECAEDIHISQMKLSRSEAFIDSIINIMQKENFTPDDLGKLPVGLRMPIKEILYHHRNSHQENMSLETATFLGREDVLALRQKNSKENISQKKTVMIEDESEDSDGMVFNEEIFKYRFNKDLRVNEVKRLLNSSVPVLIHVQQRPDVTDHAFAKEEEARLSLLCNRTMSLSVARGMFTLGVSQPDASKTVSIPVLDLTGRSVSNNKTIQIPQTDMNNARLMWPNFHNGVAAGLKIAPGSLQIDSTWILFNKLKCSELNASHSGFLFALGLMGHISALPKLHLHDYLIKGHELTTIALLMGTAATQIGTKNTDTYKLLCVHWDSLLPPTALELNMPQASQIAAIISLGLLFFGSSDLHLVNILLKEINREPGPEMENATDRESHALAAGFALGMIMIGQGTDSASLPDLNIFDQLYYYVNGGKKKKDQPTLDAQEKRTPSCQILEGNDVNTDVTAPAAIMALALMYLKTNNRIVANMLKIPNNENIMDVMKPDRAMFRVLAYNLIMWDEILPTDSWLKSFAPEFQELLKLCDKKTMNVVIGSKQDVHYQLCIITGCFLALAIKFAGSSNQQVFNLLFPWINIIQNITESSFCDAVGGNVLLESCLDTILISLAMVMAGSGNIKLLRTTRQLHKRWLHVSYGNHMCVNMAIGFLFLGGGRYTLKTDNIAIASLLCAVYPKWPVNSKDNRFHLQALRHLYVLACEPRLFVTRDVETKEICYTPISITIKECANYPEMEYKILSPCFIPETVNLKKITTMGPRYWPVSLTTNNNNRDLWFIQIQNMFVKKKAGYLSYTEDPKGYKNMLGRTFTNQSEKLDCIKAFNSSANVALFEQLFCNKEMKGEKEESLVETTSNNSEFYTEILYECVRQEKLDVLNDYIFIEKVICDAENDVFSVHNIEQIFLLCTFYLTVFSKLRKLNCVNKDPLLNQLYLMRCQLRLEDQVKRIQKRGCGTSIPLNYQVVKKYFGEE